MKKMTLLIGIGIGYVLGSRAGRERFEQIRVGAQKLAHNPTVQSAATKAQETVAAQAPMVADVVREKATHAASAVTEKMHRGGTEGEQVGGPAATGTTSGTTTASATSGRPTDRPTS